MPELPEVEIIKLGLQKKIVSLKIKKVDVLSAKSFQGEEKSVIGKKVTGVFRRAKILGVEVGDTVLIFHLKMSGQIIFANSSKLKANRFTGGHPTKDMLSGDLPNKSTRVIFEFSDNSKLYFNDQRKFGWIKVASSKQLLADSFFKNLGPEPLDKSFTFEIFKSQVLKKINTPIKVTIMDQTIIAGVGNIYANEALFLAGIHPNRKTSTLTEEELKNLYKGIVEVLKAGVKYGGSSRTHYVNSEGVKGTFLDHAFVYNLAGKKCQKCQGKILKIVIGGRGSYFCEICQK